MRDERSGGVRVIPTSSLALVLLVLVILPGAMYTWAYERQVSAFGVTFADRFLRFFAISMIYHLVLGWPEFFLVKESLQTSDPTAHEFALLWVGVALVIAVPASSGTVVGGLYATRKSRSSDWLRVRRLLGAREDRLLEVVLGRSPAPRAWDAFFSERPTTYLRVKTTDGQAVAGLFADQSYAGGFPEDPDLLLEEAWSVDDDGTLLEPLGYPVYVAKGQIARLEVIAPDENGVDDGTDQR
jgi:hypothetical protein